MLNSEKFPIKISLDNAADFTQVTILDADDQVSFSGYGNLNTELSKGIYTVRVERNGQMTEKVIRHTGVSEMEMESPKGFSSALISGYETSHEYYTGPAETWSKSNTKKEPFGDTVKNAGQLFIFIRFTSAVAFDQTDKKQILFENFSLINEKGIKVTEFQNGEIQTDFNTGWAAFSQDVVPGAYYLTYRSISQSRVIPINIYKNWQTQLFITFYERPLFEGIRVFMARPGAGFRADDPEVMYVDEALKRLQNGDYYLPDNL